MSQELRERNRKLTNVKLSNCCSEVPEGHGELIVPLRLHSDIRTLSGCGIEHIECRRTVDAATAQSYSGAKLAKLSHPSPLHS